MFTSNSFRAQLMKKYLCNVTISHQCLDSYRIEYKSIEGFTSCIFLYTNENIAVVYDFRKTWSNVNMEKEFNRDLELATFIQLMFGVKLKIKEYKKCE